MKINTGRDGVALGALASAKIGATCYGFVRYPCSLRSAYMWVNCQLPQKKKQKCVSLDTTKVPLVEHMGLTEWPC